MKTYQDCVRYLREIGLTDYSSVIIHHSDVLDNVLGQTGTFVSALLDVVNQGNVFSYALITDHKEPYLMGFKSLEEAEQVRKELLAFDIKRYRDIYYDPLFLALSKSQGRMFSNHPHVVVCANGQLSRYVTRQQPLDFPFGQESPFQAMLEIQSKILVFGEDFTGLHELRNGLSVATDCPIEIQGSPQGGEWHQYFDHSFNKEDFNEAIKQCIKTKVQSFAGVNGYLIDYQEAVQKIKEMQPTLYKKRKLDF